MKISPSILGRHLHDAAIEQLASNLSGEGYEVQWDALVGDAAPPTRADMIARRGSQTIVYEVKVLGDRSRASLANIAQAARDAGAQFRLIVVQPQREVGIEIEGVAELVLKAFQTVGQASLDQVAERIGWGWQPVQVTDVELDAVAVRDDGFEVSGAAVATLDSPDPSGTKLTIPVKFVLWLDAARHFTRAPVITLDTSDLDD